MSSSSKEPAASPQQPHINPRNPLPLSATQESQVRELYYKRVRTKCADEVRGRASSYPATTLPPSLDYTAINTSLNPDFASCCSSRTFTATLFCRAEQKAMNMCMMKYATQAEQDAAREEWFATMDKRREERERKEEKRKVDEKFWREWWDKDLERKPIRGDEDDR